MTTIRYEIVYRDRKGKQYTHIESPVSADDAVVIARKKLRDNEDYIEAVIYQVSTTIVKSVTR